MPFLTGRENSSQSETMRLRIMAAALDLFVERGFHNVSVHDVQARAGVSIGSIYKHFGGKEGIANALYDHLLAQMLAMVNAARHSSASPRAQCERLIGDLMRAVETDTNIMAFVFSARHREFITDRPPMCSAEPFVAIRDMVAAGMEQGEFVRQDPWVAASAVFGTAIRMIQLRLDGMIPDPLDTHVDAVIAVLGRAMGQ